MQAETDAWKALDQKRCWRDWGAAWRERNLGLHLRPHPRISSVSPGEGAGMSHTAVGQVNQDSVRKLRKTLQFDY